jgi:hypothetical protein
VPSPQPVTTGLLLRQFGLMVTIGSVPAVPRGTIGAPASAMKCAQLKYGPGSQCIPAWNAPVGPGTWSWPMTCARLSGKPNRLAW